jgi:hypothetical protein
MAIVFALSCLVMQWEQGIFCGFMWSKKWVFPKRGLQLGQIEWGGLLVHVHNSPRRHSIHYTLFPEPPLNLIS